MHGGNSTGSCRRMPRAVCAERRHGGLSWKRHWMGDGHVGTPAGLQPWQSTNTLHPPLGWHSTACLYSLVTPQGPEGGP